MEDTRVIVAQAGVVPVLAQRGGLRVGLISSSSGRRWVLPKGMIDRGETAVVAAAREAEEEAGIRGELIQPAIGEYSLRKWGLDMLVEVFALRVTHVAAQWPESGARQRCWVTATEAAAMLDNPDVVALVRAAVRRVRD